jgi:hypothetical protein
LNGQLNGEPIQESQDDFSVPSATTTNLGDAERVDRAVAAKLEGLGITHANMVSPSFSQTKKSSDELVATASSVGTPEPKTFKDEPWTNGEGSTPSGASKGSPPSTPDTPTPLQRRKETNGGTVDSPTSTHAKDRKSSNSPEHRSDTPIEAEDISLQETPKIPSLENRSPSANMTPDSNHVPTATSSAKRSSQHKNTPSPHRIPKYKIALASNPLTPAKSGAAST